MQRLRTCRGQSLVEFALVLPLMVTVMLGIVDFGFVYFVRGSVENAAREGARYGSIHPADVGGITNRVKQTVMGINTSSSDFKVDVSYPDVDPIPANRIRVAVTYPLLTFWPGHSRATTPRRQPCASRSNDDADQNGEDQLP